DHLWVEDILEVSVRARYDVSGARGRGDPQHGHRFLECARPVVQTWQDMAVDIDHAGAKLKLHSLELAVERFPLDSKNLRGLTFISSGGGEDAADLVFLRLSQGFDRPLAGFHSSQGFVDSLAVNAIGQDRHSFHYVLQLANVPWPGVLLQSPDPGVHQLDVAMVAGVVLIYEEAGQ